jgi:nifR3 family TIM-barrel protein
MKSIFNIFKRRARGLADVANPDSNSGLEKRNNTPGTRNNFWRDLKSQKNGDPIFVMAPMADVTDAAFRRLFAKYGKPDVTWTEFVSSDGLKHAPEEGRQKLMKSFEFTEEERPIVAQIFGANPDNMREAAALVQELGFDGVDINMGCPDRSIERQGSGAAMVKNKGLAQEVIRAVQKGAPNIPVSVKIRLGYNSDELEEWLPALLETNPALITIHARTRKEMSKVPAKWDRITRAVEIRDEVQSDIDQSDRTLIFGNGDVVSLEDARGRAAETGCDGVMIGRGIFGSPWFFSGKTPDLKKRLEILIEHTDLFMELCTHKHFAVMKKHFKAYVEGFDGAKELRIKLMETSSAEEVRELVEDFIKKLD